MRGERCSVEESHPQRQSSVELTLERRFRRRILVMAAWRLRDPSAAEDIAQETLQHVLQALRSGRLEDPQALPAFVYQTARHLCLQRQRRGGREGRALGRLASEPQPINPDPIHALISAERRHVVRRALAQLKETDRALIRMLYYEELDARAVAEHLNLTDGALRVRRHRALRRLGEILSGE